MTQPRRARRRGIDTNDSDGGAALPKDKKVKKMKKMKEKKTKE